ncbi:hypothetical protein MBCUR_06850 [Methanobrevibacter curvatus]|uniref:Uncharacterized protein n=1 Tax=Methanobrevibacter curvatus TaxID=49547 RepID=A0A166BQI6_9EURY|nr:hypothetical protein MBCUR_06850 [Methanobrevibacter curvatus]
MSLIFPLALKINPLNTQLICFPMYALLSPISSDVSEVLVKNRSFGFTLYLEISSLLTSTNPLIEFSLLKIFLLTSI